MYDKGICLTDDSLPSLIGIILVFETKEELNGEHQEQAILSL